MKKLLLFSVLGLSALGATTLQVRAQESKLAIGAKIDAFTLPNAAGGQVQVGDWKGSKATVLMFIATRCPISKAYDTRMKALAKNYEAKGVKFYGINSNKQEDNAEIVEHAKEHGFSFPVLKDAGNKIADRFGAQVTPEVFVIGANGNLLYHGQIDSSREEKDVKTRPLQVALDAIVAGKSVSETQTQAFGCSIKRVD